MIIGGLVKFSLNDFPGKTAAVVFTRGCNFRCPFCHNPELVLPGNYAPEIPPDEIFNFLESRKGKLDAVAITGGEPTQHPDLLDMLKKIKEMGFLAKIDTNGTMPDVLQKILDEKVLDYIAMDIKAPFEKYETVVKVPVNIEKIKRSIDLIKNSGLPHEFRTTVVKDLTSLEDLQKIAESIRGADNYFLQRFVSAGKLNDDSLVNSESHPQSDLLELASRLVSLNIVKNCEVR